MKNFLSVMGLLFIGTVGFVSGAMFEDKILAEDEEYYNRWVGKYKKTE